MTDMVLEEGRMRSTTDFLSSGSSDRCRSVRLSSEFCSLRRSLRYRARHSGDSDDIARGHGQLEVLIDPSQSPVHGLPDTAHGLAPAEVLLDALSDRLAQRIRSVSRRSSINRAATARSEEHTSELQSLAYLVCRLLLEKKKKNHDA